MNMGRDPALLLLAAVLAGAGVSGCGLKGPLTLPEKSGNVVVRDKATATGSGGAATQPGATATPGAPKVIPPAPPLPAKMPPPELPPSSSGTSR
jgi:predicted small lipoprotein YifL